MSFEATADLADLCEYDEYEDSDSYNVKTYQTASSAEEEYGIPLSVELSESLGECRTLDNKQTPDCFVKSSEIFLRFDSNDTICGDSNEKNNDASNRNEGIIPVESKDYNDVVIRRDCVEVQYENEFDNSNDELLTTNAQIIHEGNNSLDNDYEELLLEGIP